jgi:Pro-kumamolisin, activation domain
VIDVFPLLNLYIELTFGTVQIRSFESKMAHLSFFIAAVCIFIRKIAKSSALYDDLNQFNLRKEYSKSEASVEVSGHESVRDHVFRESAAGLAARVDLIKKDRAPRDHHHEVIFAVQQKNLEELTRILHDISDPDSDNYGQHKTREMIEELTSNPNSREVILNYLLLVGATVTSESLYGEYITARAPITLWENLFDTEFFSFHHSKVGTERVTEVMRAERYSVPRDLHEHVASVFHTVQMPLAIWGRPLMEPVENYTSHIRHNTVTGVVTPSLLNSYYRINSNIGSFRASQAVFETIGQYFSPNDLLGFQQYYGLPEQPVSRFIGGHVSDTVCTASPESCMEANLDVQYIMAVCQKSPTTHWYTDENSFANWLLAVANNANPPLVISISYGASEEAVTTSELNAFNIQAIKLGAMGVTILAASGGQVLQIMIRNSIGFCTEICMLLLTCRRWSVKFFSTRRQITLQLQAIISSVKSVCNRGWSHAGLCLCYMGVIKLS